MNVILGFVVILLLSFAASRLTLFRSGFSIGLQYVVLAGTEFLFVGLILGPRVTNLLTDAALQQLTPVLGLGLGWIGLLIGIQFDWRIVRRIPRHVWLIGFSISSIAFSVVSLSLIVSLDPVGRIVFPSNHAMFAKQTPIAKIGFCVMLGLVATLSTHTALALIKHTANARGTAIRLLRILADIRTPIAVIGLGFFSSLLYTFLPFSSLPPDSITSNGISAPFTFHTVQTLLWFAASVLLGVALGWMLHYLTSERLQKREMLLVLTGSVIFSSGLAASFSMSPLFVNFVVGATLSNLPNFARGRVSNILTSTEKPFFVVFMIFVGALWPPVTGTALIVSVMYLVTRAFGLCMGTVVGNACFLPKENRVTNRLGFAMLPQGGVAIALVVDYAFITPGPYADLALSVTLLTVLVNQLFGANILTSVLRRSGDLAEASGIEE